MTKRRPAVTHILIAVALLAVIGHVCALTGHVHAATSASAHGHAAPITDHEHSDGDALHAASCEAVRSGAATAETPTVVAASSRTSATDDRVETRLRAAESAPPTSSPPLYLTHRTLLI
jgi:hypothetical protein